MSSPPASPTDPAPQAPPSMYEYRFVTCAVEYRRGEPDPASYRRIIEDQARQGWRFVQIFVPIPGPNPSSYELIFERTPTR